MNRHPAGSGRVDAEIVAFDGLCPHRALLMELPRSQENADGAQRLERAKIRCLLFVAAAQDGLTAGATE